MSNLKAPDPELSLNKDPDSFLLLKSFKLAEELKVGDKIRFCELLLLVVLEEDENSGSILDVTEVVAK